MLTPHNLNRENITTTMSRRFNNQNHDFLRFNTKLRRDAVNKISVININSDSKKNVTNSPKKEEKIPTVREILETYLENTSIHGLQYFGKTNVNVGILGKILWTSTIVICFVCLSLMVIQFLHRYNENPTNTYVKSFDQPIFEAPFPAVTICPLMPIPLKKSLAILENSVLPKNVSREIALEILTYGHFITAPYTAQKFKEMDKLKAFLDANKWSTAEFVKNLINCEDIFESCWWSMERIDCAKSIKPSYTSYGLCCSFNYFLDNYVKSPKSQQTQRPLASADFGLWSGLKLVINKEVLTFTSDDNTRNFTRLMNNNGIEVLIHHRMGFPGLNTDVYTVQANHELQIAVKPQYIKKPEGLQHRNKEKQLVPICIAEHQNTLEYFSIYQYSNCYANCRIKAMIQMCGCLPFIYDNIAESYNIPRCEIERLPCIKENAKLIGIVKDIKNKNITCLCRTPCENIDYDGYPNLISLAKSSSSNTSDKRAIVRVYMYSQSYEVLLTLSAADETYLLASVGGIFSLFLGCSFLSVVEIVYYIYLGCCAFFARKRLEAQTRRTTNEYFINGRRRVY
ncbi:sodium channel protein Nach-like [Frieseomelitta varia]|uniref:sodium channel protein Nach-like n=1 Tax=Frieseomelitta varia TaxID=561572 RepID=UPI001CB6AA85|nr:sodium channel protein Nach-like [Frieseomelitta varia]